MRLINGRLRLIATPAATTATGMLRTYLHPSRRCKKHHQCIGPYGHPPGVVDGWSRGQEGVAAGVVFMVVKKPHALRFIPCLVKSRLTASSPNAWVVVSSCNAKWRSCFQASGSR